MGDRATTTGIVGWVVIFSGDQTQMLLQYKHDEQALSVLEVVQVPSKDPHEVADAMGVKIQVLYYTKRYKQLIKDVNDYFEKLVKKQGIFYYWRGFALYQLGRKQEALKDFNLFLSLSRRKSVRDADEFVRMFPLPKK
ncbi:MAG: hypothetical protein MUF87_16030 [Anaerolineae bacterium]|nr:hypothetical protein [Anaerolineae bacterium]